MTDDELDTLIRQLEDELTAFFHQELQAVGTDYRGSLDTATSLTAAAFSVSSIAGLWRRRVPGMIARLLGIGRRARAVTAADVDLPEPDGDITDLPGMDAHIDQTRFLLEGIGDTMAADATAALRDGLNNGETQEQLRDRLLALFAADGAELSEAHSRLIAVSETTRMWNAASLATAQALTGPDRPLVKQWRTRGDEKVRPAHRDADGQVQFLDDPFDVGTEQLQYPGDPSGSPGTTINCRCHVRMQARVTAAGGNPMDQDDSNDFQSRMPEQLKMYWLHGEGAAKIGWGTPGSFERCVANLKGKFPKDTEGLCANLYHEATGHWPGQKKGAAAAHTGAMVALVPSDEHAQRLAITDGEPAGELHTTLYYLGEAGDWSDTQRAALIDSLAQLANEGQPIEANAFGVAQWNATSDEPAWVYNIGGPLQLSEVRGNVSLFVQSLGDRPQLPDQHTPWTPHVTGAYASDNLHEAMTPNCGPVTFDRMRIAFGGEVTDLPLTYDGPMEETAAQADEPMTNPGMPQILNWSTPEPAALAFENQQTGDGRVFAPGALYWDGDGPWPLQYAEEMNGGHNGAELCGAIEQYARIGDRITGSGVLYLTQDAGQEAAMLLSQGAPLGVSVDLDDVDLEVVVAQDSTPADMPQEPYMGRLLRASLLPLPDGGYRLTGETPAEWTAAGTSLAGESRQVTFHIGTDGKIPADAFEIVAAAGDTSAVDGTIVEQQRAGDVLMRITRARVRGATLVTIPAYAAARIVLDQPLTASYTDELTASDADDYNTVVRFVRKSRTPVSVAGAAHTLKMSVTAVKRHMAAASRKGLLVQIARGQYIRSAGAAGNPSLKPSWLMADGHSDDMPDELTAAATGAVDLPVLPRDTAWDGQAATDAVFAWATDADGNVDTDKVARAFAYRDDSQDASNKGAYKLGYATVDGGTLKIVPKGVSAALGAINGARGGVDLGGDAQAVKDKLMAVQAHVDETLGGDGQQKMEASAWTAMQDMPPMPADWFREPTTEELPPGGAGVNYSNGRIFGWVAQAGEPHAGFAKKITIDGLGRIDTSHFLRQRFTLDNGEIVKAGTFTMNAGHHRDGAECETAACQFDDTRFVAGIVTVGMNERGMWFSGAAAPWLSEWDRSVFMACQPSYHMRKGTNGQWQLRAVLSVPVPGHSSPLLASAVAERAQLALTAAATMAEVEEAVTAGKTIIAEETVADAEVTPYLDYDRLAAAIITAQEAAAEKKQREADELAALMAEAAEITASDLPETD